MAKKKSGAQRKAAKKATEEASTQQNGDVEMNGNSSDSEVEVIDPPSTEPTTGEGWKEKGTESYKSKNYSEAVKSYTKALEVDPSLTAAQFNRAAAYMALRDYPSALQDCREVLAAQKPRQAKTLARMGKIQLALAQTQPAEYSLEEAKSLADEATSKAVQADLAKLERLNNHLKSAQRERERASWQMVTFALDAAQREVEEVPMQWKIWRLEALIGRGKLDEAQFLATDLVRASQSNPEALYWRGIVFYKQGNWDQAKIHFERSVGLDPDNAQHIKALKRIRQFEARREAGKAAFASRNYAEALEKYTEALEVDPENEQMQILFRSNRALALTALKKYDEVIEDCDVILGIQSDHFKALRSRARARLNTQNYEGAVQDFKAALEASDSAAERQSISSELENAEKELKKSKQKDYYKELGLDRTQSYSEDEIKKAYRKQSLKNHPDKGGTEEKFKEIGEAYSVLSDPVKRRRHDAGEDLDGPSMDDMFAGGGSPFGFGGGMGGSPFGHSHGGFESSFGGGGGFGGGMGGGINLEDLLNAQMGGGGGRRSRRPF